MQASLTPTAAISGRVYGASGEPLGNVDVSALKPSYQDGRRILTAVQTMRTDDRGEYRLFWLPPAGTTCAPRIRTPWARWKG